VSVELQNITTVNTAKCPAHGLACSALVCSAWAMCPNSLNWRKSGHQKLCIHRRKAPKIKSGVDLRFSPHALKSSKVVESRQFNEIDVCCSTRSENFSILTCVRVCFGEITIDLQEHHFGFMSHIC